MKNRSIVDPNELDRGPSSDGYLTKLYRESKRLGREGTWEAVTRPASLTPRPTTLGPVSELQTPAKRGGL